MADFNGIFETRSTVVAVIFAAEDYDAVSLRSFGDQGVSPPFQLLLPRHVNVIVCDLQ